MVYELTIYVGLLYQLTAFQDWFVKSVVTILFVYNWIIFYNTYVQYLLNKPLYFVNIYL